MGLRCRHRSSLARPEFERKLNALVKAAGRHARFLPGERGTRTVVKLTSALAMASPGRCAARRLARGCQTVRATPSTDPKFPPAGIGAMAAGTVFARLAILGAFATCLAPRFENQTRITKK
jgi:hypothetical protein